MSTFTKPEVVKQRIEICAPCEYKKFSLFVPKCSQCGCFIATKVRLENSQCPIGKWMSVKTEQEETTHD